MRSSLRQVQVRGTSASFWGAAVVLTVLVEYVVIGRFGGSPAIAVLATGVIVLATSVITFGPASTAAVALTLAFSTAPWDGVTPISRLSFLQLSDLFFVVGFLLLAPRLSRTELRLPTVFTIGALGLAGVAVLSALVNADNGVDIYHPLVLVAGVALLPALVAWWRPSRRALIATATAYLVGNAMSVITGLAEGPDGNGRYAGLTTHPNAMAACCAVGLALVPFAWQLSGPALRWLLATAAALNMVGVWISGSRAALLAVVALTVIYPLVGRSTKAAFAVAIASVPVVVLVARVAENPDSANALSRLLGGGSSGNATVAREEGAQGALQTFLGRPLIGSGWTDVWQGHDIYLQTAAAIGIFGLTFLLLVIAALGRPLLTLRSPYRWLAYPTVAGAFIGLMDPALGARYIWAPMALSLAAPAAAPRRTQETPQQLGR